MTQAEKKISQVNKLITNSDFRISRQEHLKSYYKCTLYIYKAREKIEHVK